MKPAIQRPLRVAAWLSIALLAGCASLPVVAPPQPADELAQREREQRVERSSNWQLQGKVAVRSGDDGGSGQLLWEVDGSRVRFELSAPVTGKSWRLSVDGDQARIDGLEQGPVVGPDAEQLIRDAVGWSLPIAPLAYWIRGARAPGSAAQIEYSEQGLPLRIRQAGWEIEYRDWTPAVGTVAALPRKLFARRGEQQLRLVVARWSGSP